MLICINRNASIYPVLQAAGNFCLNILHEAHDDIAHLRGRVITVQRMTS